MSFDASSTKHCPAATWSRRTVIKTAALAAPGLLGFGRASRAASAYPHLADLAVTLLVGSEVGGGYDLCARTLARHLEREVQGLRISIKNVPQASGKLAASMLQEGPADGSMLFTSTPGLLSAQLLGEEGVAFDLGKWSWVGKVASETRLLAKGPSADFADLEGLRAKIGTSPMSVRSTGSYIYHEILWLNALLGMRIKPVPGYKAVEKDAALINGEVMLASMTYPTDRKILETPGLDVVLRVTDGETPEQFAHRPLLADLMADRPGVAPILKFMRASGDLLRWFAAPPSTDRAVLEEWRHAFDATVASPDFVSEAGKLDFKIAPMTGQTVEDLVTSVLADQAGLSAQLQATLQCGKALADGLDGACSHS